MSESLLWPRYSAPQDLVSIESVPIERRGLPASTYDVLRRAAELWPESVAINVLPEMSRWQQPTRRTFRTLLEDVHRVANLLHHVGVGRTDTVALISPNCDELITATLAAQLAGIAAPINGALSAHHVTELLRRSGARILIAASPELDTATWEMARAVAESGDVDTIFLLAPTGQPPTSTLVAEIAGTPVHYLLVEADQYDGSAFSGTPPQPSDLAALFHTGGTTAAPKLAAHTHANEVTDAWMLAAYTAFEHDLVVFAGLPLFHVNALIVTLLGPLLRGQRTVWAGPLGYRDPAFYQNFWKVVAHFGINSMSAVPTIYSMLTEHPIDADISSLRFAIVGASPLPPTVRRRFESHTGVPLIEGYGLTEATCATARGFRGHTETGSVGQRLPYQQVKAVEVEEAGLWRDVPASQRGTLVIKGPNVFPGYVVSRTECGFNFDTTKLRHGWLDTGDVGWVDDRGFVYLKGRAKDVIIRGGHNIDPAVIEDALLAHPDVTAAAAVGRPDPHSGEVPVAFVTISAGSNLTAAELTRWATGRISERAALPKTIKIIEALPVTAVGKPHKVPLRAVAARDAVTQALASVAGVVDVSTNHDDNATVVVKVVLDGAADQDAVAEILGRYPINHVLAPMSEMN